jgi:hypothetical protein
MSPGTLLCHQANKSAIEAVMYLRGLKITTKHTKNTKVFSNYSASLQINRQITGIG